jgi:predicted transglutaminase-like cysteine proteinase
VPDSSIGKSSDSWKILTETDSGGDCEDFALTKLQKLLEYGWPISKLHLECGVHVDENGNRTGHVWLVAESDDGIYVLDNGTVSSSLTTREVMQAVYNKRNLYQVSGMTWLAIVSGYEVIIEKPDTIPIDSKLLAFNARFLRRYREEGSKI